MMPILLVVLITALLVMVYLRKTTTLTRNCRWRQSQGEGHWRCAYCGAIFKDKSVSAPRLCLAPGRQQ